MIAAEIDRLTLRRREDDLHDVTTCPMCLDPGRRWLKDLTDAEQDRLAEALRRADYMNWSAAEVAASIAPTVRAIAAARLDGPST